MTWQILHGDALSVLRGMAAGSVHAAITSPPYFGLRAYAGDQAVDWPAVEFYPMAGLDAYMSPVVVPAQRVAFGAESDPMAYVGHTVAICRELRRVLRDDGLLWWNLGDSYAANRTYQVPDNKHVDVGNNSGSFVPAGLKPKDLLGIPWRVALALQADGWYLRSDIIWHKLAPMPESVTDRPTKAHEYVFLLAKSPRYFYDAVAVAEAAAQPLGDAALTGQHKASAGGYTTNGCGASTLGTNQGPSTRNRRSVWSLGPQPYAGAHFATWPPALVEPMILASTSARGCCPACGAPWVRVVEREGANMQKRYARGEPVRHGKSGASASRASAVGDFSGKNVDVGWRLSCTCAAGDPVPCVVLDPFNGSGTTGAVAVELGRDYIGIEIAAEYIALAEQRIGNAQPALLPVGV